MRMRTAPFNIQCSAWRHSLRRCANFCSHHKGSHRCQMGAPLWSLCDVHVLMSGGVGCRGCGGACTAGRGRRPQGKLCQFWKIAGERTDQVRFSRKHETACCMALTGLTNVGWCADTAACLASAACHLWMIVYAKQRLTNTYQLVEQHGAKTRTHDCSNEQTEEPLSFRLASSWRCAWWAA